MERLSQSTDEARARIVCHPQAFAFQGGNLSRGLIGMQRDADCGDLDHGEVVGGEFVVACGDAPELLKFVEESLDPVAQAVEVGTPERPASAGR